MSEQARITRWLIEGEVGLSSKSLAAMYLNERPPETHYPRDPSDFRRCVLFLEACIDPHNHIALLDRMAEQSREWEKIRDNWSELMLLFNGEKHQKTAPKLYARMNALGL